MIIRDKIHANIYGKVKNKLNLGAGNKEDSLFGVKNRIELIDSAKLSISKHLIEEKKLTHISESKTEIGNIFILALLSEALECGNCGETAAVTLVEYIKNKYPGSAEIILLLSSESFLALNHFMVSIDSDPFIELKKIEHLNGRIVDTYLDINHTFKESKEYITEKLYEIISNKNPICKRFYRIENCETFFKEHKDYLLKLFTAIRQLFNSDKCDQLLQKDVTEYLDINLKELKKKILDLIERDIVLFIHNPFIIKHWTKPPDYSVEEFSSNRLRRPFSSL